MKYYGLKNKIKKEDFLYWYAKRRAKLLSILPGKKREFWKNNYNNIFEYEYWGVEMTILCQMIHLLICIQ